MRDNEEDRRIAECFWEKVQERRIRFTWDDMEKRTGYPAKTLSAYCSRKKLPSITMVLKIANALEVPIRMLMPKEYTKGYAVSVREVELIEKLREGDAIAHIAKTEAMLKIADAVSALVSNVKDIDIRKIDELKAVQTMFELSEDCGFSPDAFMAKINALYEADKLGM